MGCPLLESSMRTCRIIPLVLGLILCVPARSAVAQCGQLMRDLEQGKIPPVLESVQGCDTLDLSGPLKVELKRSISRAIETDDGDDLRRLAKLIPSIFEAYRVGRGATWHLRAAYKSRSVAESIKVMINSDEIQRLLVELDGQADWRVTTRDHKERIFRAVDILNDAAGKAEERPQSQPVGPPPSGAPPPEPRLSKQTLPGPIEEINAELEKINDRTRLLTLTTIFLVLLVGALAAIAVLVLRHRLGVQEMELKRIQSGLSSDDMESRHLPAVVHRTLNTSVTQHSGGRFKTLDAFNAWVAERAARVDSFAAEIERIQERVAVLQRTPARSVASEGAIYKALQADVSDLRQYTKTLGSRLVEVDQKGSEVTDRLYKALDAGMVPLRNNVRHLGSRLKEIEEKVSAATTADLYKRLEGSVAHLREDFEFLGLRVEEVEGKEGLADLRKSVERLSSRLKEVEKLPGDVPAAAPPAPAPSTQELKSVSGETLRGFELDVLRQSWRKYAEATEDIAALTAIGAEGGEWRRQRELLLRELPRRTGRHPDLHGLYQSILPPVREYDHLVSHLALIPRLLDGEVAPLEDPAKDLLRVRECTSLLLSLLQSSEGTTGRLRFDLRQWIAGDFCRFADVFLRAYQTSELEGEASELAGGLATVREVLGWAEIEPIEIELGRTKFDSRLHTGQVGASDPRFPDGSIVRVDRSGFRTVGGPVLQLPKVIVNRV